jgi:tetratricopeptide (TPR) repeat protein
MNARDIPLELQPLRLLINYGLCAEVAGFIAALRKIAGERKWYRLEPLLESSRSLEAECVHYPALLVHFADAFRQAERLDKAGDCCRQAVAILQRRTEPGSLQNGAVASFYRGALLQLMRRTSEAVDVYRQAHRRFLEAALGWRQLSHPMSTGHATDCEQAARRLEGWMAEALESMVTEEARRPPQPTVGEPGLYAPTRATPRSKSAPAVVLFLAVAASSAFIVALGIVAYELGKSTALITFGAAVISASVATVAIARAATNSGFLLKPGPDHWAVYERGKRLFAVYPGEQRLLIPWLERARFLVPLGNLQCHVAGLRISRQRDERTGGARSTLVWSTIDYRVANPLQATHSFDQTCRASFKKDEVFEGKDLRVYWEAQLLADMRSLLSRDLWGVTAAECHSNHGQIQADLSDNLEAGATRWGLEVTEVILFRMVDQ